jgi:hypothetical protein
LHIKQISLAAAIAAAAGIATAIVPATAAQAATSTAVPLPIAHYSHMVVDPAHQHIFFSEGSGYSSILVTDFSGNTVATISNEPGATGLALSPDGSTVYAALANGDAVSAISTSTLAETDRYATGAGTDPTYVAAAGGRIWFGYGAAAQGGLGSIDPSTSPATVNLGAAPGSSWYSAPLVTANPQGELVVGETSVSPPNIATYDVSSGAAVVLAPETRLSNDSDIASMALTPDGQDVVLATGAPYYHQVYKVSDLSQDGTYSSGTYPNSVSVSGDGSVAAGIDAGSNEVFVYAPRGSSPLNTYNFDSNWLAADGVAFTPDGTKLFAVTSASYNGAPTLNIESDPEQTAASLSLTAPASSKKGEQLTVSGTLGGLAPYTGGQTLHVTSNGVALPDVTTAADGSFSFTDTPKNKGTYTYQVSYAGDAHLTAATASATVTVG